METTESMVRDDAEELGDDPKEFLFPCAQDHYTLSDSIKEDTVTGMISGEDWSLIHASAKEWFLGCEIPASCFSLTVGQASRNLEPIPRPTPYYNDNFF